MIEIIFTLVKVIAFVMFIIATYKSAQYYKNRANTYETEIEKEISKETRRKRAVEHFENLENRE